MYLLRNGVQRSESDLGICMRVPYKRYMTTIFDRLSLVLNSINLLPNFFLLKNHSLPVSQLDLA